jgi:hypothetical protein
MSTTVFDSLNRAITAHGGHVNSPPGMWPIRFDVHPASAETLTQLLAAAGWTPLPRGSTTRLSHGGFSDALVFELARPKEPRA